MIYARMRQYFPMREYSYLDDRDKINDAEVVKIEWPKNVVKPRVGIVRDIGIYPRWTKYSRFLDNNSFEYELFDIHSNDWIEKSNRFGIIIGIVSSDQYHLEELQKKYYFLENYLGKICFPNTSHAFLYENKSFEAYFSRLFNLPYANTYISHSKEDAIALINSLKYPFVSKVDPSSGSVGVELVRTPHQARKIIEQAFSRNGRKVHVNYFRQKNYIYFQEFIPNDGYDIRVHLVDKWAFGYYRKVLGGDFRASGMDLKEKREIPEEAIRIAWNANKYIKSPLLVVDMVHGLDGKYTIVEFSPVCRITTPEELQVQGIPGVYIIEDDGSIHFEKGRYWIHELALREFLLNDYLPKQLKSG
jgi:glutathione synthase/RimK-type ligase-like ATP-grasp enzyme